MKLNENAMDRASRVNASERGAVAVTVEEGITSLDAIIRNVCRDANYEAMRFVLRSNVGQDGE